MLAYRPVEYFKALWPVTVVIGSLGYYFISGQDWILLFVILGSILLAIMYNPLKDAKEKAEIAELQQRERLAKSDIPINVASDVAKMREEAKIRIQIFESEEKIKVATKHEDAKKVLELTKQKALLEKELERLRKQTV
jgi:uncharacterized membrane protein